MGFQGRELGGHRLGGRCGRGRCAAGGTSEVRSRNEGTWGVGDGKNCGKTMKDLMELQMSEKALVTRMYKKINLEGDVW